MDGLKATKRTICIIMFLITVFLSAAPAAASTNVVLSAEETAALPRYDGREHNIITKVKDQGTSNLCWAYSSIAASEVSILKSEIDPAVSKDSLYLNPVAVAYRAYRRQSDPMGNTDSESRSGDYTQATGNPLYAAKLFSMWWGPVAGTQPDIDPFSNPSYRLENAFYIPENKSDPDQYIKDIKLAVAKYGAVTFQYNNLREVTYYNPKNESGSGSSPHACTVIGWDDNISADSFVPGGASRNGGWLIKNSYKSLEYFWLSYDNTSSSVYAFSYSPKEKYDFNYYYDGGLDDFVLRNDKIIAIVYEAQNGDTNGCSEYVKAVNVGVQGEKITVEAEIYKGVDYPFGDQSNVPVSGGYSAAKATAFFEHGGYVTVELENQVKVEKGEWFSVIVRVSNEKGDAKVITSYKSGKDLSYYRSGESWYKLGNFVGRVKAYTALVDDSARDIGSLTADGDLIYGIEQKTDTAKFKSMLSSELTNVKITPKHNYVGTGTTVEVTFPDDVSKTYTAVLFGDVDGDGIYDGRDAVIINMIADGMLPADWLDDAIRAAADCNRDGTADNEDSILVFQAGIGLSQISQSGKP